MKRLLTLLLLSTFASAVMATTLYRWVDEDGRVHFSDQPQAGAEEVTVRAPTTFSAPEAAAAPRRAPEPAKTPDAFKYGSLKVVQPVGDETLWNIAGELSVSVALSPGLRPGHKIQAHLGGRVIDVGRSFSFTVPEVYRGEHNLSVSVSDASGKEQIRSKPVKFFVQQTRVSRAP